MADVHSLRRVARRQVLDADSGIEADLSAANDLDRTRATAMSA